MPDSLLLVLTAVVYCAAEQLPDVYWNSSNQALRSNELGLTAKIMDSVDIHCPYYEQSTLGHDTEQLVIYRVSSRDFSSCHTSRWHLHPVGRCQNPFEPTVIRHMFRAFSPMPNGLEYTPGQTYYFVSLPLTATAPVSLYLLCTHYNHELRRMAVSITDENGDMPVSPVQPLLEYQAQYVDDLRYPVWRNPRHRAPVGHNNKGSSAEVVRPYEFQADRQQAEEHSPLQYIVSEVEDPERHSVRLYGHLSSAAATAQSTPLVLLLYTVCFWFIVTWAL